MKILIHYMYRGESRVSNDILKEVLHAGDVLKVRGLYRGDTGKENKSNMNIEKPHTSILRPSTSHHATPLNASSNMQNITQIQPEIEPKKLVSVISPPTHGHTISPIARTNKSYDQVTLGMHPGTDNNSTQKQRLSIEHQGPVPKTPSSHLVNFLTTIKEEPVEWNEEYGINEIKCDRKQMFVKEEVNSATLPQTYQKLSCEICSEDFILPADWVRHVERHTEHAENIPRKRRRSGMVCLLHLFNLKISQQYIVLTGDER